MYFRRDRGIMSLDEFPQFEGSDAAMSPQARAEAVEMSEWVRSCMAKLGECDEAVVGEGRSRNYDARPADADVQAFDSAVSNCRRHRNQ